MNILSTYGINYLTKEILKVYSHCNIFASVTPFGGFINNSLVLYPISVIHLIQNVSCVCVMRVALNLIIQAIIKLLNIVLRERFHWSITFRLKKTNSQYLQSVQKAFSDTDIGAFIHSTDNSGIEC